MIKHELSFNWDIHWVCNYNCPYCWFAGKWEEAGRRSRVFPPETIIAAWERMHRLYGPVKLSITGGEPFIYPRFDEIIEGISRHHFVEIISNLSRDISGFIEKVKGRNVVVNPSFHALSADSEDFIRKVKALREHNMVQAVTFLAWPPLVRDISRFQKEFEGHSIRLNLQPFNGEYEGRRYPESYTAEEKRIITPDLGERGDKPFSLERTSTKGRLCNAGKKYGVIHPDGTVLRCGGMNAADAAIGNIYSKDFRLNDRAKPCTAEICPCNEWAMLLEKE
jgi:organic radical activating enzyme